MSADRPPQDQLDMPLPPEGAARSGNDGAMEPGRGDAATECVPEKDDQEPARADAPAPAQPGDSTRIGQYELIRTLGRGGMGEVFLARDLRLGRLVAIKRLSKPGPELARRFSSEARTTARCMHENIVVIHEVDEHEGAPSRSRPCPASLTISLRSGDTRTPGWVARSITYRMALRSLADWASTRRIAPA